MWHRSLWHRSLWHQQLWHGYDGWFTEPFFFFSCRSCVVCKAFSPFQIGPLSPPPPLLVTTRRRWTTAAHCPITFQFWPKSTRNNLVCVSATQHTTPQHHNTTTPQHTTQQRTVVYVYATAITCTLTPTLAFFLLPG